MWTAGKIFVFPRHVSPSGLWRRAGGLAGESPCHHVPCPSPWGTRPAASLSGLGSLGEPFFQKSHAVYAVPHLSCGPAPQNSNSNSPGPPDCGDGRLARGTTALLPTQPRAWTRPRMEMRANYSYERRMRSSTWDSARHGQKGPLWAWTCVYGVRIVHVPTGLGVLGATSPRGSRCKSAEAPCPRRPPCRRRDACQIARVSTAGESCLSRGASVEVGLCAASARRTRADLTSGNLQASQHNRF